MTARAAAATAALAVAALMAASVASEATAAEPAVASAAAAAAAAPRAACRASAQRFRSYQRRAPLMAWQWEAERGARHVLATWARPWRRGHDERLRRRLDHLRHLRVHRSRPLVPWRFYAWPGVRRALGLVPTITGTIREAIDEPSGLEGSSSDHSASETPSGVPRPELPEAVVRVAQSLVHGSHIYSPTASSPRQGGSGREPTLLEQIALAQQRGRRAGGVAAGGSIGSIGSIGGASGGTGGITGEGGGITNDGGGTAGSHGGSEGIMAFLAQYCEKPGEAQGFDDLLEGLDGVPDFEAMLKQRMNTPWSNYAEEQQQRQQQYEAVDDEYVDPFAEIPPIAPPHDASDAAVEAARKSEEQGIRAVAHALGEASARRDFAAMEQACSRLVDLLSDNGGAHAHAQREGVQDEPHSAVSDAPSSSAAAAVERPPQQPAAPNLRGESLSNGEALRLDQIAISDGSMADQLAAVPSGTANSSELELSAPSSLAATSLAAEYPGDDAARGRLRPSERAQLVVDSHGLLELVHGLGDSGGTSSSRTRCCAL